MRDKTAQVTHDFDPHFKIFYELMPFKVQEILLVSSPYDAFILEEDGSLATRLTNDYLGLNLSGAPRISLVSSGKEAIERLKRQTFQLVITMPNVGGMDAFSFATEVKKIHPQQHIVLMAHSLRGIYPVPGNVRCHSLDNIYLWCCESDLLLAVIKNFEDHVNVESDTQRAMVRVIILVEDSPVYRSFFLPLIYHEVVHQTQAVLDESLNESHRLLRMRARPKILSATNYEEAMALYEAYKPYVFAIISDVRFPRRGQIDPQAGLRLLQKIRAEVPDLPMLALSSEPENRRPAETIPAVFIDKDSPSVKEQLHDFFLTYLGFGDFVFRTPVGEPIDQASNLFEFEQKLKEIPAESISYHAERNHFSNWVMARAEVALATKLHKDHVHSIQESAALRDFLVSTVHSLRKLRQRGIVVKYSRERFDPDIIEFVKIGNGSMGGKARSLAFIWMELQKSRGSYPALRDNNVVMPNTCVITADGFDDFIASNKLRLEKGAKDQEIAEQFLAAALPDWLLEDLHDFLSKVNYPLSVRSSSLLEDAHFRPYAGLYSTYFLANNHPSFAVRCMELENAIKLVYASTWFESPRAYSRNQEQGREDSMAVIVQQVVGKEHGKSFYPHISGVAQSHNYYPILKMKAEEGICHIALGIGKTVVEGERSLRFSPAHPKHLIQFSTVSDILRNSQRKFYALDMNFTKHFDETNSNLLHRTVQEAEDEEPVRMLASTYIPEEDRIRDTDMPGPKVMSFARVLKHGLYPLAPILQDLLLFAKRGLGCEIEIEFAVVLHKNIEESKFYFLQMRPMVTGGERSDVRIGDCDMKRSFCFSSSCLGHGRFATMQDIVLVRPESFDPAKSVDIASEINGVNGRLQAANRSYLLVGPGRWGSADPWLGVPVQWRDISGVGAIIELQNDLLNAEPSQGSHFFQNITSLGIPYVTVREGSKCSGSKEKDCINWSWFMEQEDFADGEYVRHIRLKRPFVMKCDGKKEMAVLYLPEEEKCKE